MGGLAEVRVLRDELARGEGRALRVADHRDPHVRAVEGSNDDLAAEFRSPLGGRVRVVGAEGDGPAGPGVGVVAGDRVDRGDDVLEAGNPELGRAGADARRELFEVIAVAWERP